MESLAAESEQDLGLGQVNEARATPTGAEAVGAWLASGEELESYCQRTGQSVWSLRRWRREHAERFGIEIKRRPGARDRDSRSAAATMIPVQIVGAARPLAGSMTIEVRLARQRAIVMPSEIDGATLARLVAAVEAAP